MEWEVINSSGPCACGASIEAPGREICFACFCYEAIEYRQRKQIHAASVSSSSSQRQRPILL